MNYKSKHIRTKVEQINISLLRDCKRYEIKENRMVSVLNFSERSAMDKEKALESPKIFLYWT